MAGVQVESVIVKSPAAGSAPSIIMRRCGIGGSGPSTESDVHRVLEACAARTQGQGKAVLHSLPTGFSIGDMRNVRDPKGMMCDELGGRYACGQRRRDRSAQSDAGGRALPSGRSRAWSQRPTRPALRLWSMTRSSSVRRSSIWAAARHRSAVFAGGSLVHVDAVAVGGNHVTMDIARGFNTRLADAERLKTLYGACITSCSDERETVAVTLAGEDGDHPTHVPKSQLVRIIRPRVEEILELTSRSAEDLGLCFQLFVAESSDWRCESK